MTNTNDSVGVQVIAYWKSNNPNHIYLTRIENRNSYVKRGYAYRDATEHEYEMFMNGTTEYEKSIK